MKNRTLAPLLSLLFIATLLASHLIAMDDSAIMPRPLAATFAYHRCIPTLLSLAITKASYEDIEKKVPEYYQVYDYALNFKDNPREINPLESLKLDLPKKFDLENERRYSWELEFFYVIERNKKCLEHLLAHTDFTQNSLNNCLQGSDNFENLQTIQLLVKQHARGEFFDRWQEHPLHNAIVRHAFLGENFRFTPTDDLSIIAHEKTPLNLAAAYNLAEVVKALAPLASQDDKNVSLCIAASYGAESVILPLIANGANVNACSLNGRCPLIVAVQRNPIEIAQFLIDNGADVNKKILHGSTPILLANSGDMTSLLIRHGANINANTWQGRTALHCAAIENNVSQARVLLDAGALVNAETDEKSTPLHFAAANGTIAIARLLIASSANVHAKDGNGKTPFDLVQENIRDEQLRDEIIALLNSAQQDTKTH